MDRHHNMEHTRIGDEAMRTQQESLLTVVRWAKLALRLFKEGSSLFSKVKSTLLGQKVRVEVDGAQKFERSIVEVDMDKPKVNAKDVSDRSKVSELGHEESPDFPAEGKRRRSREFEKQAEQTARSAVDVRGEEGQGKFRDLNSDPPVRRYLDGVFYSLDNFLEGLDGKLRDAGLLGGNSVPDLTISVNNQDVYNRVAGNRVQKSASLSKEDLAYLSAVLEVPEKTKSVDFERDVRIKVNGRTVFELRSGEIITNLLAREQVRVSMAPANQAAPSSSHSTVLENTSAGEADTSGISARMRFPENDSVIIPSMELGLSAMVISSVNEVIGNKLSPDSSYKPIYSEQNPDRVIGVASHDESQKYLFKLNDELQPVSVVRWSPTIEGILLAQEGASLIDSGDKVICNLKPEDIDFFTGLEGEITRSAQLTLDDESLSLGMIDSSGELADAGWVVDDSLGLDAIDGGVEVVPGSLDDELAIDNSLSLDLNDGDRSLLETEAGEPSESTQSRKDSSKDRELASSKGGFEL